jgi:hypothetical protein
MVDGTYIAPQGKVVSALTDGTGISPFNWVKFVKDFIADVLLSGAAALVAVGMLSVDAAVAAPQVAFYAILGAVIRAAYRAVLRWATTE